MSETLEAAVEELETSLTYVQNYFSHRPVIRDSGVLDVDTYSTALQYEYGLTNATICTIASMKGDTSTDEMYSTLGPHYTRMRDFFAAGGVAVGAMTATLVGGLLLEPIVPILAQFLGAAGTLGSVGAGAYTWLRMDKRSQRLLAEKNARKLLSGSQIDIGGYVTELNVIAQEVKENPPCYLESLSGEDAGNIHIIQNAGIDLYRAHLQNIQENITEVSLRTHALLPQQMGLQKLLP